MVAPERWKDPRSTGRKNLRRNYQRYLASINGQWACQDCGRGPSVLPVTIPPEFAANLRLADPEKRVDNLMIEVDHADKDLLNADPSNATAFCVPCHKRHDLSTEKGVSRLDGDVYGHAQDFYMGLMGIEDDPNFVEEADPKASRTKELLAQVMESVNEDRTDD